MNSNALAEVLVHSKLMEAASYVLKVIDQLHAESD